MIVSMRHIAGHHRSRREHARLQKLATSVCSYIATHPRNFVAGEPPEAPLLHKRFAEFAGVTALPVTEATDNLGQLVGTSPVRSFDGYFADDLSLFHVMPNEPPRRLDLGLEAYVEVALRTRGLIGWRRAVHAIVEDIQDPVADRFYADASTLFACFSATELAALVRGLRLSAAPPPKPKKSGKTKPAAG